MKIHIENLGILCQAEFELADMTIICGGNNTGKTYATYALFGFLSFWREALSIPVNDSTINQLLAEGSVYINLDEYVNIATDIIAKGCNVYVKRLHEVFAAPENRFRDSEFFVSFTRRIAPSTEAYEQNKGTAQADIFSITKSEGSNHLIVTLLIEKEKVKIPTNIVRRIIGNAVKDIIFSHLFPRPFIASAERTGVAIFRNELNFARNRLLEELSQKDKDVDPFELLTKEYKNYALPVETNVDFTRKLEKLARFSSFITENHPDLLNDFSQIIGGEYIVTRHDELYFIPRKSKIKLSMDESSSAVRSLLDLGFYLRHVAQRGDLLMIDEPELNLHPENQRYIARLFARLVNIGIKIFLTTHSDYIIKELNTLIMLNHDRPHLKKIVEREKYIEKELLSSDRVKVYIAEKALMKQKGKTRQIRCNTLTPADISPELGIEARSFDKTIEEMNRIQEEIIWGGE